MRTVAHRIKSLGPFRLETTSDRATALAILAAGILALAIASPSLGTPRPGDPGAFAGDPRFVRCGGEAARVRYVFEIERARDYRTYLPLMPRVRELLRDAPALVVVFDGPGPFVTTPTAAPGQSAAPATSAPGRADVCIYVAEAGAGQLNYYRDMPIGGLRVVADGPSLEPLVPDSAG